MNLVALPDSQEILRRLKEVMDLEEAIDTVYPKLLSLANKTLAVAGVCNAVVFATVGAQVVFEFKVALMIAQAQFAKAIIGESNEAACAAVDEFFSALNSMPG